LDLHGPTFARVLDYLRTGTLSVDGLNPWECRQLQSSMEYLQLVDAPTTPTVAWKWAPAFGPGVLVSSDGRVLHAKASAPLLGKFFVRGDTPVSAFVVQVMEVSSMVVGLCPATCLSAVEASKRGCCTAFSSTSFKHDVLRCQPGDVLGVRKTGANVSFSRNDENVLVLTAPRPSQLVVPFVVLPRACTTTLYLLE
ncbi:hypothetical protein DYB32_010133, partial [Aphanomyces invadans]